ncbi:pantoate--beta-alanine ligase [Clostridia bacterium]|nr:pantoate--beta-alanine ligase [Clostridia bacterium]
MKIIYANEEIKKWSRSSKKEGKTIGFVPTMGALHEGHLSLIRNAKKRADLVVVSIFVNPTQFGPHEDFELYPRDTEKDLKALEAEQVDAVFIPDESSMYGEGYRTYIEVEHLTDKLCGASRPGHFRGVTTVVAKFFNLIQPNTAFFGRKDYQQLVVIRKMVEDLNMDLEIVGCPIIREHDGLALSSRNRYLSMEERNQGLLLSKTLKLISKMMQNQALSLLEVRDAAMNFLMKNSKDNFALEYLEWVNADNLERIEQLEGFQGTITIAMAAQVGKTRLIDNIQVEVEDHA